MGESRLICLKCPLSKYISEERNTKLKYQEGEEVYYKDGTIQVISAIGNPNDPCPYYIGTIKVPERDLMPRDISLKEFKSKFCNALRYYTVKQALELVLLYPERAQEYYETLV